MKKIIIAGGCFWGVEAYYKKLKGVLDTSVGYANGNIPNPSYEDLKHHLATHSEAVEITYDEKVITLTQLLDHMFRFIDPTSVNRQGNDIGLQYRTGVYYKDEEDKKTIEAFIAKQQKYYSDPIAVEIAKEANYYLAEDYHQDYLEKNPQGYCHINFAHIKRGEQK
ncbi:MAG: peptide-methionine (S)-S-oxide reductase MsrA [Firmicutes bacterium]|nr:peptide-methionine (S)-S-oxide reductase MsrA [Bacillota bacterium]